jgi:peptidoglycan-associated lipoprotein
MRTPNGITSRLRFTVIALLLGGVAVSFSACKKSNSGMTGLGGRPPVSVPNVFTGGDEVDAATGLPTENMHGGTDGPEAEAAPVPQLPDVLFAFDDDSLTPQAEEVITKAAAFLLSRPDLGVVLRGHTDERGTEPYNIALGQRRAHSVRQRLIARGIPPARVQTISFGQFLPIAPGSTETEYAKNRRVEFFVFELGE